jgi:hypothetical protein
MKHKSIQAIAGLAAVAATALGGASPALAASSHHQAHAKRHATKHAASTSSTTSGSSSSSTGSGSSNGEVALTGSTLTSAEAAAIAANAGATANSATTETDSSLTGAAYEVHITRADGSHAVVIEDAAFNVLATQAGSGCGGGNQQQRGN